jgi:type I restriction enzyme R subunit
VDAKNVRNIVLMRPVNSMIEFKQIIGRGTRTFEGKNYFTVYDFVKAHEKFDDPEWDGDPADIIVHPPRDPKDPPLGDDKKDPVPIDDPGGDDPTKPKRKMIEVKLADDHIVTIAATTFWGPDGKPISAQDFIKRMFGELPELFKDEDDLRAQWSDPDTRKALLERLAERSYGEAVLGVVRETLMATESDLFDVLAHVAYSNSMRTREFRAEAGRRRIGDLYNPKIAAFLEYVLDSYVEHGENNLDRSKLNDFVKLKFGTAKECAAELGGMPAVIDAFVGFQRHLYTPSN